eukprot:scaffold75148_cov67-Cyclotella_meneghiniana.AAC.1
MVVYSSVKLKEHNFLFPIDALSGLEISKGGAFVHTNGHSSSRITNSPDLLAVAEMEDEEESDFELHKKYLRCAAALGDSTQLVN